MAQDLYGILGLAKGASDAEIRKAYRNLAKELHPDHNPDDKRAEERFKQVSKAYDILKDKDKRQRYDRGEIDADGNERGFAGGNPFGAGGARRGGFRYQRQGGGFEDAGNFEDLLGGLFGGSFGGAQPGASADVKVRLAVDFFEAARGTKKRVALPNGETVELAIPAGTTEGQVLRLRGKARGGGGGGRPGDVLVEIAVTPHPRYARDGLNVLSDVDVPLVTAIEGGKVTVSTLDGDVSLTVPAGASSGRQLRLRGRGFTDGKSGTKGDHLVRLLLVLPTQQEAVAGLKRWAESQTKASAEN